MIAEDLSQYISEPELMGILGHSDCNKTEELTDLDVSDFVYDIFEIELRPRIYLGDFCNKLWCVEVYDWNKKPDNHIKNLVGFTTRKEAVHKALIWYYTNHSVKNS